MAIEALIADRNDNFAHFPHHNLESILYVILYICTFTNGPNSPQLDFETPDALAMKSWFTTDTLVGTTFSIGQRRHWFRLGLGLVFRRRELRRWINESAQSFALNRICAVWLFPSVLDFSKAFVLVKYFGDGR